MYNKKHRHSDMPPIQIILNCLFRKLFQFSLYSQKLLCEARRKIWEKVAFYESNIISFFEVDIKNLCLVKHIYNWNKVKKAKQVNLLMTIFYWNWLMQTLILTGVSSLGVGMSNTPHMHPVEFISVS
jgi:hypothetical protein